MKQEYTPAEFVRGMREMRDDTEKRIAKWLRENAHRHDVGQVCNLIETGEWRSND